MSKEILMVVDAVSNEKGVEKEIVFEAIETRLGGAQDPGRDFIRVGDREERGDRQREQHRAVRH